MKEEFQRRFVYLLRETISGEKSSTVSLLALKSEEMKKKRQLCCLSYPSLDASQFMESNTESLRHNFEIK